MKESLEYKIFNTVAIIVVTFFAILCLVPFVVTLSGSLTSDVDLYKGISLFPRNPTLDSYRQIFENSSALIRAYGLTIVLTVVGTLLSGFLVSSAAYVLYRKDFKYRSQFAFFFYFPRLFSGGMVAGYILNCSLGLRNTFMVLLLASVMPVFQIIMVRSFLTSNVPQSMVEAAKMDGANDWQIYCMVIIPSATTILATIAFMTALSYWNGWQTASIYISNEKLYPLQYFLQKIFQDAALREKLMEEGSAFADKIKTVGESFKMAMTMVTVGPVILFYPFFQRFFVSGATVGAVKE